MVTTARSDAEPGGPSPTGPRQGRRGAHSRVFRVAWRTRICHRAGSQTGVGAVVETEAFTVPQNKDLKRLVRTRMAETGENYTQALTHLLGEVQLEPLRAAWHITCTRVSNHEAGLVPEISNNGDRVAQLRLRCTPIK